MTTKSETPVEQRSRIEDGKTVQLVSFRLGQEEYGVDIMMVQEIILMGRITKVPEVPEHILGVINLRGNVIPIVDLHRRFNQPDGEPTDETRIVVINLSNRTVGIVVDGVSEVLRINQDEISQAPSGLTTTDRDYVLGLARLDNRLLILLDVEKILGNVRADMGDATEPAGEPAQDSDS